MSAASQPSRPQLPPEPPVLIDLEPVVSGGFMNGRLDLTVRGRVAGAGLEELVLQRDDVDVSRMQVGESDHASMARFPDGTLAPQHTFQLTLPLPADMPTGVIRCGLQARSAEARTHVVRFGIMVDPAGAPPGHVVAGPLTPPGAVAGLHPPVIFFVERASLDLGGTLTVHGWAVSRTRIVTVQAFVGDGRVGSAKIGLERGDVGYGVPALSGRAQRRVQPHHHTRHRRTPGRGGAGAGHLPRRLRLRRGPAARAPAAARTGGTAGRDGRAAGLPGGCGLPARRR